MGYHEPKGFWNPSTHSPEKRHFCFEGNFGTHCITVAGEGRGCQRSRKLHSEFWHTARLHDKPEDSSKSKPCSHLRLLICILIYCFFLRTKDLTTRKARVPNNDFCEAAQVSHILSALKQAVGLFPQMSSLGMLFERVAISSRRKFQLETREIRLVRGWNLLES